MDKYFSMCLQKNTIDKMRQSDLVLVDVGEGYYMVEKNRWGDHNRERYKSDPKLIKYIEDSRSVLIISKSGKVLLEVVNNNDYDFLVEL